MCSAAVRRKVLIAGGAGFSNAGDEALLLATVQICRRQFPRALLSVATPQAEVTARTLRGHQATLVPSPRLCLFGNDVHYRQADPEFMRRWQLLHRALVGAAPAKARAAIRRDAALDFVDRPAALAWLAALAEADVLVVHGGGIFTSATRSRLWEHSLTVELAAGWGKPVVLRSHQFGPFDTPQDEARAVALVRAAGFVSSRDLHQSAPLLHARVPQAVVHQLVDDALRVRLPSRDVAALLARHGLRRGRYLAVAYRDNKSVGIREDALGRLADIVAAAQRLFPWPVALLPQGPTDVAPLQRLAAHLRGDVRLVRPGNFLSDPVHLAASAGLMIALPHHSLIFALRGGVPVLSAVMGDYYRFKNVGSLRHFGLDDHVVDVSGDDPDYLRRSRKLLRAIADGGANLRRRLRARRDRLMARSERTDAAFRQAMLTRPQAPPAGVRDRPPRAVSAPGPVR